MSIQDVKEEDITWELILEEAHKLPEDPVAQIFLGVQLDIALLKELCHRAYMDSDIRLKEGWILDYKRLVEND